MSDLVLLLLLVIAFLIGVLVYVQRSRRSASAEPSAPAAPRDPFADMTDTQGDPRRLKAGDMVEFGGDRSWIRGSLRLSEGGYTWAEHFLEVEEGKRWLSVEEDPDLEIALWTGRPELDLTPHGTTVELEGVRYRLNERGSASYRSEGTTGLPAQGGMDYADYASDDGRLLAFERFDHGRWEASTGVKVMPGSFTVYPGS